MITISNQIELRHFRYFLVLAEQLNYHRAAELLYISQPGLSRQIKQMEELLEVQLFIRKNRRVQLTQAGEFLRQESQHFMNKLDQIHQHLVRMQTGDIGQLRIGYLGSAMQQVIPRLLLHLRDRFPGIRTTLREMANDDQVKELIAGKMDIGFVRLPLIPPEMEKHDVAVDRFVLVLPADHDLTSGTFVSLKQVEGESFIFFSSDYSPHYYQTILSIFAEEGFSPKISHLSVHAQTIFKLVEQGMGIAIVPYSLQFGFDLKVKFLAIPKTHKTTTLSAIWLKDSTNVCLHHLLEAIQMANE